VCLSVEQAGLSAKSMAAVRVFAVQVSSPTKAQMMKQWLTVE
jgi:hypothetical protein